MSLKRFGSGVVMEKPSARNAGGLPRLSVQIKSSWRMKLFSRPCVQLKKCARACTRSDALRLRTIDSICRKSVAAERASGVFASALPGRMGACAVSAEGSAELRAVVMAGGRISLFLYKQFHGGRRENPLPLTHKTHPRGTPCC